MQCADIQRDPLSASRVLLSSVKARIANQIKLVDLDVRGIGDIGPFPCFARSQDAEGVSLTCQSGTGGDFVLRSRYLVACDGANSFVRRQLAIRLDDLAFDEWWMVVDAFARDMTKRPNKCFQYCWPSRPGTFLSGPGALRRWEIKLLRHEQPDEQPDVFGKPDNVLRVLSDFTDTSDLALGGIPLPCPAGAEMAFRSHKPVMLTGDRISPVRVMRIEVRALIREPAIWSLARPLRRA